MKSKHKNLAVLVCIFLFSQQFISCKKDNAVSSSNANAYSEDGFKIQNLPIDSSLVAWYPFINGKLNDKSHHHNNIIFSSAARALSKNGVDSGAYYFDGTSSYMRIKNSKSLNPLSAITLAALVKPMGFYNGICHANWILFKGYDGNSPGQYLLGFDDQLSYDYTGCYKKVRPYRENLYGSYGDGTQSSGIVDTTQYIKKNKWYTLVYTFDGAISRLYINNVLVGSVQKTTTFTSQKTDLCIGMSPNPKFPYNFTGIIDEIRIYNRALSEDEVLSLHTAMGNDDN